MSIDTVFKQVKKAKDITLFSIIMIKTKSYVDEFLICGAYRPKNLQITCHNTRFVITYNLRGICTECKFQIDIFNYSLNRVYICNKVSWIFV